MKNNKKKGFTLVELLVVIAILAILATVSVVGYMGFTKKANLSKAQTELVQVRNVITGELSGGSKTVDGYTISIENGKLVVAAPKADEKSLDAVLKSLSTDLTNLDGVLTGEVGSRAAAGSYTTIIYTLDGGYSAYWNIVTGDVTTEAPAPASQLLFA